MRTVAALFVDPKGSYANIEGVELWDESRDARLYRDPYPVVAHPPCQLWTNMAGVNFVRYGGTHNRPGNDQGCFSAALIAVRLHGGVLEHPAGSWAWPTFGLRRPVRGQWTMTAGLWRRLGDYDEWVTEVSQSAYGHPARKRTWLLYCGREKPPPMDWSDPKGTHQVGWFDRKRPTLGKRAASSTPPAFRDALLELARSTRPICF